MMFDDFALHGQRSLHEQALQIHDDEKDLIATMTRSDARKSSLRGDTGNS